MGERPLWSAEDQASRLAELTARTADLSKELPLRRDIRSLGMLLGKVLVEQAGEGLLNVVEELRRLLIGHREQDSFEANPSPPEDSSPHENERMRQAREIVARLRVEDAYRVSKAFAIYF